MDVATRWKHGLALVFSKPKYVWVWAAFFTFLLPIYAALTNIMILEPLSINPNLRLPETALIILVAALASVGFTVAAFSFWESRNVSKRALGGGMVGMGAGGGALATFATTCTICQPIWLVWLGLGGISAFLVDYSMLIALASIAFLLYSIDSGLKQILEGCKLKVVA